MNATLVLVQPDGSLKEIPLTKQVTVMGRQTDCQLRIPSAGVSRHHCEVVLSEGGVKVRDLGSSNGTFVNKQKVEQKDLSPGDMISIGGLVFVLRVDGKPQFIDAEDAIEDGLVEGVSGDQPAAKPRAHPHARLSIRARRSPSPPARRASSTQTRTAAASETSTSSMRTMKI